MQAMPKVKVSRSLMKLALLAALAGGSLAALAGTGTVTQLSGTLSAKRADGTLRILSQKSEVQDGDTLSTERDSYGQIRFSDGGQITLKPNTTIQLQSFRFSEDKPQENSFVFGLLKGGLRAITGLVGKFNPGGYRLTTETSTVGIRGTTFGVDDCVNSPCRDLAAAIYVNVSDGEIVVRNESGETFYQAGQFGMIEKGKRPLFLSTDPGLAVTPPASFFLSVAGRSTFNAGKDRECIVGR
jgi:hypothetical protein